MIKQKWVGSVYSGKPGSVCSGIEGSVSSGQLGSVWTEFPIKHPQSDYHKIINEEYPNAPPPPPPPPMIFYGFHNFILADANRIFYHNRHSDDLTIRCFNGYMDYYNKPSFIGLIPNDIREIKPENLLQFLKTKFDTLKTKDELLFLTSISSPTDTIKNPALIIIADFLKANNIYKYSLRNSTAEEKYALKSKINNQTHNSDSAKFYASLDSTDVSGVYRTIDKGENSSVGK